MANYHFKYEIKGKTEQGDPIYACLEGELTGARLKLKMKDKVLNLAVAGKVLDDTLKVEMKGLEKIAHEIPEPETTEPLGSTKRKKPRKYRGQKKKPPVKKNPTKRYERKHPKLSVEDKQKVFDYLEQGRSNKYILSRMKHIDEWHIRGCKAYLTRKANEGRK